MSVSERDNWSSCSECQEEYEDQHFDASYGGTGSKHPVTGENLCFVCTRDLTCKVCGHVGCGGVQVMSQCMECVECFPESWAA